MSKSNSPLISDKLSRIRDWAKQDRIDYVIIHRDGLTQNIHTGLLNSVRMIITDDARLKDKGLIIRLKEVNKA